jgi:hypothetical protein
MIVLKSAPNRFGQNLGSFKGATELAFFLGTSIRHHVTPKGSAPDHLSLLGNPKAFFHGLAGFPFWHFFYPHSVLVGSAVAAEPPGVSFFLAAGLIFIK